jgi:integrase
MPKHSENGHVRKRCPCGRTKWPACSHPWFTDFKAPKDHPRRGISEQHPHGERYQQNLNVIAAANDRAAPQGLREAQDEARRAITAWLDGRDPQTVQPTDRPTLAKMLDVYGKRPNASAAETFHVKPITATVVQGRKFGEWRAADITREALDAFRAQRPKVAANRNLAFLRAAFNWAVVDGLVPRSPFRVGDVAVVRLTREDARTRRLPGDEEERLLLAANGLRPLIVAALETGMRLGELLSLQWSQVGTDLFLPAGKTKAKKPRRVPISTALHAVLDARRADPAGDPLPPEGFVFGDEIGRRRESIKTAWRLTCSRAGIKDLHFHDLRREAGSRWMDAGVPLATIQRWLGHHNISQTSKYLAASLGGDADDMRAFEQRIGRIGKSAEPEPTSEADRTLKDEPPAMGEPSSQTVH